MSAHELYYTYAAFGCVITRLTRSALALGVTSTCLHLVREYGVPFTKEDPVAIKFRLSWSIHTNSRSVAPSLVEDVSPLKSPRCWISILDRAFRGYRRVAVFITPMNRSPIFLSSSAAPTDAKYESAQTTLSELAHGRTNPFKTCVP